MSALFRAALASSLESVTEEINPLSDHVETDIDEVLLEVAEAQGEVDTADRVVDELETAEKSLEAICAALESHIAEGGMSPQTARSHQVSMNIVLGRLGVSSENYTISTESFGGTGDKLTASQEALSGAKEVLTRIWTAIKNAVEKAYTAVKNFIQTIGKSAPALMAGANQLKARAQALRGKPLKGDGDMDAGAAAKALHIDGKFDANTVGNALKAIVTGGNGVAKGANDAGTALLSIGTDLVSGSYDKGKAAMAVSKAAFTPVPGTLPGGYVISKKIDADAPSISMAQSKKYEGEAKIKAPSVDEVIAISNEVVAVARFLQDYSKKAFVKIEKDTNTLLNGLKKEIDASEKDPQKAAALKANLNQVTRMTNLAKGVGPQFAGYAARSAKAALSFGSQVLKQYGDKPAAAEGSAAA